VYSTERSSVCAKVSGGQVDSLDPPGGSHIRLQGIVDGKSPQSTELFGATDSPDSSSTWTWTPISQTQWDTFLVWQLKMDFEANLRLRIVGNLPQELSHFGSNFPVVHLACPSWSFETFLCLISFLGYAMSTVV
jgi:hypothetical protein